MTARRRRLEILATLVIVAASAFFGGGAVARPPEGDSEPQAATESIERPGWLGAGLNYREDENAENPAGWFFVRLLIDDGPAAKAGLMVQDIITEINGESFRFTDGMEVLDFFGALVPGEELELTVVRGSTTKKLDIVAIEMPADVYEKWLTLYEQVKKRHEAGLGHL